MHAGWKWVAGAGAALTVGAVEAARGEIVIGQKAAAAVSDAARGTISVPPPGAGDSRAGTAATADTDVLSFLNGDRLHGRLVAVEGDGQLVWKHPAVADAIRFRADGASFIALAAAASPGTAAAAPRAHKGSVRLTNGDQLRGDLVSLDATNLVLDTWYAGRLVIQRVMVERAEPNPGVSSVLYEGPKDLTEWTTRGSGNRRYWECRNGALYPSQSIAIGRVIEQMPDRVRIDFTATWRATPYFGFWFFNENPANPEGDAYFMNFMNGNRVDFGRMSRNEGTQNFGFAQLGEENDASGRKQFTMLADRKERKFALLVDGGLVREWTDPREFKGTGKAILFMPHSGGNMKFSAIRVSQWDGKIPKKGGGEASEEDMLLFANGDSLSGELVSVDNGQAKMKTSYAALDIPLDRISDIRLAAGQAARARRNRGDVRGTFREGGSLTLKLEAVREGRLAGASENLGAAQVPLAAFGQLEFNIYEKKETPEEDF